MGCNSKPIVFQYKQEWSCHRLHLHPQPQSKDFIRSKSQSSLGPKGSTARQWTRMKDLEDHSGGPHSNPRLHAISSSSLTPPSTEKGPAGGEMAPNTDDQISEYIWKRLAGLKAEVISNEEMIPEQQFSPKTQTLDIECVSGETDNGLHERHLEWQTDLSVPCGSSSVLEDEDETAPEKPSAGTLASAIGKVPEPSNKNSPFETNSHEHVELRSQMKTEQLPRLQTNHSVPCGSSSVSEDENETDDGWITIPIVMSDLKFEPEDEGQVSQERVVPKEVKTRFKELPLVTQRTLPRVPSLQVYDSIQSFYEACIMKKRDTTSGSSTSGQERNSAGQPHIPRSAVVSDCRSNSCETEDSCYYSSGSEYNTMTGRIWKKMEDSVSKDEDDVMKGQDRRTRSLDRKDCIQKLGEFVNSKPGLKRVQQKSNGQMFSKEWMHGAKKSFSGSGDSGETSSRKRRRDSPKTSDIWGEVVVIDSSDQEDESDQELTKTVRRTVSDTEDNTGTSSQQESHSPGTLDTCPVIPRFLIRESSRPNLLIIFKE